MRYLDLIEEKQLGRAFNHLEDLVFFYGSAGTIEALEHLKDIATEAGAQSIRMKWDGNPQIYWGRAKKGGPLIFGGHNAWSRGNAATSAEEVQDFIANKSGSPKSPEDKKARDAFANQFASMYPYFDRATPKDFIGFVYADGLFLDPPTEENGVYTFCPNPKSKTCYHVKASSELGRRISRAKLMVVGHAYFPEWGLPDSSQEPMQDFSAFDNDPRLIVLGPVYNSKPVSVNTQGIDRAETYVRSNGNKIDQFLQPVRGLADLKNIIYTYVNQTAKAKQLDRLSGSHFGQWLQASRVSANKQAKIKELNEQHDNAIEAILELVKMIQEVKDDVIDQVEGEQGDIWDSNGEGRVRYADPLTKQFGNVKLVPRKRWTPS